MTAIKTKLRSDDYNHLYCVKCGRAIYLVGLHLDLYHRKAVAYTEKRPLETFKDYHVRVMSEVSHE